MSSERYDVVRVDQNDGFVFGLNGEDKVSDRVYLCGSKENGYMNCMCLVHVG